MCVPTNFWYSLSFNLSCDQLLWHVEELLYRSMRQIFGRMLILQTIFAKMNCCIQRNRHKKSPYQRIRIEVVHVVSWFATNFLSQVRVHFLKMWNIGNRYLDIVWPLWVDVDDVCTFSCRFHRTRWKVQVLVRFCSSRSLQAYVRFYIWLPHLRTRRCVILIWIFSSRLPCTSFQTQALTGCSEYRRAVRRPRTLHRWRACYSLRNQVHHRSWLCHNYFFSCSFLCPFRYCLGAAGRAEIADVEQTEEMVPLITCEIAFCQHVCELVLGVNVLGLDFLVRLILSNNQSSATLRVRDTCLIVGFLPLMIILITASLSSKM